MRTRISVPITVAALAAGTALFISTPGAVATQGQPVIAGTVNTASAVTAVWFITNQYLFCGFAPAAIDPLAGLGGCGPRTGVMGVGQSYGVQGATATGAGVLGYNTGSTGIGVYGKTGGVGSGVYGQATANGVGVVGRSVGGPGVSGNGATYGVQGVTATGSGVFGSNTGSTGIGVYGKTGGVGSGVYGQATTNGVGVNGVSTSGIGVRGSGATQGVLGTTSTGSGLYGENTGPIGIGVQGKTGGTGSAVYGQATTNGVGVYGVSANGTGVWATSPSGTALRVIGKATFSRSGIVIIDGGSSSKAVSLAGVTASSMVVATAQQIGNVFVKAAVPGPGLFNLVLTGAAPVGGLKVAYFVLN